MKQDEETSLVAPGRFAYSLFGMMRGLEKSQDPKTPIHTQGPRNKLA